MVGQFWTSGAPWQARRLVFMGIVVAAAVSGAEALVLCAQHARRIDACGCKKLRCMMLGEAHHYDEATDQHDALPSLEVWRRWRLAPYAIETCVRRLKWWQDIFTHSDRNYHLIDTLFGELPHEGDNTSTLDEDGVISEQAHPWARQLADDLEEMMNGVEDAMWLSERWRPRSIPQLVTNEELRTTFAQIDVTAMRESFPSRT